MSKIVFMGTPDIAVPTLNILHEKYKLDAVVTVPDKPKGRGLKLLPSPIKTKALELGIEVLQPEKLNDKDFLNAIKKISPDIMVVFAFRYLPQELYRLAKISAFNIHTSLLPKYRGAAPINWAIINGEVETGLTTFVLDNKIDTGAILMQKKISIPNNSTAGDLEEIIMNEAPKIAINTCELLLSNDYIPLAQDISFHFVAPKLFKQNVRIDWTMDAIAVNNFINGCSPTPCAWTTLNGETIKFYRSAIPTIEELDLIKVFNLRNYGEFIFDRGKLIVNCGFGTIEIIEIQLAGKKRMKVADYLNGYRGKLEGNFI